MIGGSIVEMRTEVPPEDAGSSPVPPLQWKNLGLVYATDSYAQTPTPLVLADRVRVYVAARENGRSYIRYVDLALDDPRRVIGESGRVLENGKPGAFDHCGQMPSFAEDLKGSVRLWYSGWLAPAGDSPYHNATGVAMSMDGGKTFERSYEGPILDRTAMEPYLAVTPCLVDRHLWYIGGLRWEEIDGRLEPIYVIRHARMSNSGRWERDGLEVIPQRHPHECFSRPWVVKVHDGFRMYFSYRDARDYRGGAGSYRIGKAWSVNGWAWKRAEGEVIQPGPCTRLDTLGEFNVQMRCYSATFEAEGKTYMLYNGNGFGKNGFGLAVQR